MSNSIAKVTKYVPLLDEVYQASAKTSILDNPNAEFIGANIVKYMKMSMDGLGNYSRNAGFVTGDITATWGTMELTQDRGRSFHLDSMDNEETLGVTLANMSGQFIRTKVAPEIDAYTFAKIAGTSDIQSAYADIVVGTTDVADLIQTAEQAMNDEEVPDTRVLFISEEAYKGLQKNVVRKIDNGELSIRNGIEYFDEMPLIRVPKRRFYTAITLKDGTTSGQTAGGYVGTASTGYGINFMIVERSAINKIVKHAVPRLFTPNENQQADAYKFDYRIYHDCFVYDNKVKGVYLHRKSTALS